MTEPATKQPEWKCGVYCYINAQGRRSASKVYPARKGMRTAYYGRIVSVGRDFIDVQTDEKPPRRRRAHVLVMRSELEAYYGPAEERP